MSSQIFLYNCTEHLLQILHLYIHAIIKGTDLGILVSQCQGNSNILRPTSIYRQSECPWILKINEKAAADDDDDDDEEEEEEEEEEDNDDKWA